MTIFNISSYQLHGPRAHAVLVLGGVLGPGEGALVARPQLGHDVVQHGVALPRPRRPHHRPLSTALSPALDDDGAVVVVGSWLWTGGGLQRLSVFVTWSLVKVGSAAAKTRC